MSLLADIRSGATLRKTRIEQDHSAPRLVGQLDAISDSYDAAVLHCNIERWLPVLAPHNLTFETTLVPLGIELARVLVDAYNDAERQTEFSLEPVNEHEAALRQALGEPLQRALDGLGGECIVKTSSRSPKDAAARTGVLLRILRQAFALSENSSALESDEDMLRVVCEAEGAALRFSTAEDVIRALVLSERVWQDMTLALRHPETFLQNIVVRRWEPVQTELEFRCFFHAGRLTAISQYAYQIFVPSILASLAPIRTTIIDYFADQLADVLARGGFETCVVDVALLPAATTWQPRVIELNPFLPSTDSGLFSWDRERALLEGRVQEVAYPVLRVCERPRKGGLAMVPKAWKDVVLAVRREMQQS